MAFAPEAGRGTPAMAEINIIPLCDVLLVLLIIFMVTAPALSHQIDVDLPQASPPRPEAPSEPIELRIEASGEVFWNGEAADAAALAERMRASARASGAAQPLLKIDASGDSDYQAVAKVLAMARNAGLDHIGFVRK